MKSKKELLKSPRRGWSETDHEYDSILIVPAGTKHDSGFMHIAVIGYNYKDKERGKEETFEICSFSDDVSCHFPLISFGDNKQYSMASVRMDCYYPSGVLRYHGRGTFKVGLSLSSVDIYFTPTKNKK